MLKFLGTSEETAKKLKDFGLANYFIEGIGGWQTAPIRRIVCYPARDLGSVHYWPFLLPAAAMVLMPGWFIRRFRDM